jgi:hypothetical protein
LTEEQKLDRWLKARETPPAPRPPKPNGWQMAREAVRIEDETKAREAREQEERRDGTLKRREASERKQAEADEAFAEAMDKERRRHEQAKAALLRTRDAAVEAAWAWQSEQPLQGGDWP